MHEMRSTRTKEPAEEIPWSPLAALSEALLASVLGRMRALWASLVLSPSVKVV